MKLTPHVTPFATPDTVITPCISFNEITCDECEDIHGYQLLFMCLFWGISLVWAVDGDVAAA